MVEGEGNLTGGQIQEIMDKLLYDALDPIVRYMSVFDTQLIYLLATVTKNKKRKVCALDRPETVNVLCKAIASNDPDQKMAYIKQLKIERSFIHVFLTRLLKTYQVPFMVLYSNYMSDTSKRKTNAAKIEPYLSSTGCRSRSDLYVALNTCSANLTRFYSYFSSVSSQYYRLANQRARVIMETNPNNNYDFKDLVQNLLRKVVIALNKYDATNGALTPYIKWWMFNSVTCGSFEHEYGIAYGIPQNHRRKLMDQNNGNVNFSVSIDAAITNEDGESSDLHAILTAETGELDDDIASQSFADRLYLAAKRADPHGLARLTLDIPEVFTAKELEFMKATTELK